MLFGSALLILSALIFSDSSRSLQALSALFASLTVILLFVAVKILTGVMLESGSMPVFGIFTGNMGNPLGGWTDLGITFGLLSLVSVLALGIIPMKSSIKFLVYFVFLLSTILLMVLNFTIAFALTLAFSVLLLAYFLKVERNFNSSDVASESHKKKGWFSRTTVLSLILILVSLVFFINPKISDTKGNLADVISGVFKVENADVRPSLSATLTVSKAVLSRGLILGSGPNTFGHDWLIYKPVNVNTTPFWSVAFPFGVGFIPTQVASTGILGSLLWLSFFIFLIILGIRVVSHVPESRALRFTLVSSFLVSLYLWIASIVYTPSGTLLMVAFIFSGIFIASAIEGGFVKNKSIHFKEHSQMKLAAVLVLLLVTAGTLYIGWIGFGKTVSAYHFKKAVDLSNVPNTPFEEIEGELNKAIKFAPSDAHHIAISRINFAKAQAATQNTSGTQEENLAIFQESVRKSIEAAREAVSLNPAGFQNWVSLGLIYSALVPDPLKVPGSYENAKFAFAEAFKRNPTNPEIPLLVAKLEFDNGNVEASKSSVREAIALKEDYADAYLVLAQIAVTEGNTREAITSAEKLVLLVPNNPGIYFELGLLKFSNRDFRGAAVSFSKAIELAPDYANAQYYLGLTLIELGDKSRAKQIFEALATTNPNNTELEAVLKRYEEGGDLEG